MDKQMLSDLLARFVSFCASTGLKLLGAGLVDLSWCACSSSF